MQLISVSCELEKIATLAVVESYPNTKKVNSYEFKDEQNNYSYVVPGTIGAAMLRSLCSPQ